MMSNKVFYELPELEECEHGIRNPSTDCVICIEEKNRKEQEKKKEENA